MSPQKKRISLDELLKNKQAISYQEQYNYICGLMTQGKIQPVKSATGNGKKPALCQSYWILEDKLDYSAYLEEIKFGLAPAITTDYYLHHPGNYVQEQKWVQQLNEYLLKNEAGNAPAVSLNERSFEIWGREKFLQKEQGRKILKHCGITEEQLNIYRTTEPLAYYSASKCTPQNVLILENKDTFFSMRRELIEGRNVIFGKEIGTLIYGAGKGILRSFEDFQFCMEPCINAGENELFYYGDLDYEGIGIFENLAKLFADDVEIKPFVAAYVCMLDKYANRDLEFLPDTSENQNRNLSGLFFSYFTETQVAEMKQLLEAGKYIPQESVNSGDFSRAVHAESDVDGHQCP